MGVRNFDAKSIIQVFAGIPISGYAKGTFVSIEFNEDAFNLTIGADGEGCRAKSNNESAQITFTLMQSSAVNDLLSAIHNLDKTSPGGDGIGPYLLKDLFGTTIIAAEKAWIKKMATAAYGTEPSDREWVLETDFAIVNLGGNL
jgi:hypothetical protein